MGRVSLIVLKHCLILKEMKSILLKTSLIFLSQVMPVLSYGQGIDIDLLKLDDYVKFHSHEASNTINSYHQIEGTPYLYEEFKEGVVTTKDSTSFQGSFRYDIFADKMEFKSLNFVFTLKDPWTIETLVIGSHTFVYVPPFDETSRRGAYYELILPGKCRLLEKRKVALNKPQPPMAYAKAKPASFSDRKSDYYLQIGNQTPKKITRKKDLIKAFEDQGQVISFYMKQKKMSPKKAVDLIELVNYYNSL